MTDKQRYMTLQKKLSEGTDLLYAGTMLERAARIFKDKTVLTSINHADITYEQLYLDASAISFYLEQMGIEPEDRVLLLYENSYDFYRAYFGIWQTGAIVAPLNTLLHEKELAHIISDAQPKAIIVSETLAPKLANIPSLPLVITGATITQVLSQNATKKYTAKRRPLDSLAALLYTSGTTGFPKGVMLSSRNIISNVIQGASHFELTSDDRMYCALPLFHSFTQNTCVWSSICLGISVILVAHLDRTNLLQALALKPTIMLGVPNLYALFCRFKNAQFTHVRVFVSGGDALSDKVRMFFELLYGRKLCNGYGLTETTPFLAADLDDTVSPTSTVGRPLQGISCDIRDGIVRDGYTIGTLWVKGPNIMLGYYNAPEATAAVLQDGWFNTGDMARIDRDGKIVICGRSKDLIIVKGIKVYPQEIENILMTHPQVLMAAVVGKRDHNDEEYPVAYVMAREPEQLSPADLMIFCKNHLAGYKVPRACFIKSALPLTSTGKVDKKQLKE